MEWSQWEGLNYIVVLESQRVQFDYCNAAVYNIIDAPVAARL
jgi:hypothetical protein